MKTKEHPFTGFWHVVVHDNCVAGKWKCEYKFAPDEWIIGFLPDGRHCELFRPHEELSICQWKVDKSTGIISIFSDPKDKVRTKCIFKEEDKGIYIYFYDDERHIEPDPMLIVRHHAHKRYKLIKVGE